MPISFMATRSVSFKKPTVASPESAQNSTKSPKCMKNDHFSKGDCSTNSGMFTRPCLLQFIFGVLSIYFGEVLAVELARRKPLSIAAYAQKKNPHKGRDQ